eukprot:scaffold641_cov490-Prasinococcus_capsulatus_cf.AAC.4
MGGMPSGTWARAGQACVIHQQACLVAKSKYSSSRLSHIHASISTKLDLGNDKLLRFLNVNQRVADDRLRSHRSHRRHCKFRAKSGQSLLSKK